MNAFCWPVRQDAQCGAGHWGRMAYWKRRLRGLWAVVCVLVLQAHVAGFADAKARHALIVGVGDYPSSSGLTKLTASVHDADLMRAALEARGVDFVVDVLKDGEVPNKAAFEAALKKFLARVRPKDEVLFYFSGHGYHVPGQGNFFLLPTAKGEQAYLKDLGPAETRALTTQEQRQKRYQAWISDVAISEAWVEQTVAEIRPDVIIIIADACRNLIGNAKGASILAGGVGLPREAASGTYRLYSASPGQVSLDKPDGGPPARSTDQGARKADAKEKLHETSLFTRVLLQELKVPRLEINILFSKVKIEVREQARKFGVEQIPDFHDSRDATLFYFRPPESTDDIAARCSTARSEMAQLLYGVTSGSVSRDTLEKARGELAPCGLQYTVEIDRLLRLESQGAGALSTSTLTRFIDATGIDDPIAFCDIVASSPLDPDRPQGISGFDVHKIALQAIANAEDRTRATEALRKAIRGCEAAVVGKPRVARYKFNLARTHYALATITDEAVNREASLAAASRYNQEAADLGYVATYSNLAIMHQNGEYYEMSSSGEMKRLSPDRTKAIEYLKRGADQGHVVAQYNLGLAYKNGELGLEVASSVGQQTRSDTVSTTTMTREALAFQYLSRAAEGGYVPAMIQTALMLHDWPGIPRNPKRAVELLEIASSRGSWEAMFWLGEIYRIGLLIDPSEAIVWHARAAEAGDARSQTRLAQMLLEGEGLPATQPDAAGRYLRLAADAGSVEAQMLLAGRLKDNKVAFRPRIDGKVDGGAAEIRTLYEAAFARGKTEAGLHLARLYRAGFPVARPSDAIPKSPADAAKLLWDTIDKVRDADPASADADPKIEVWAAVELIKMYDAGEASGIGGPDAISQDQIDQLRSAYGDVTRLKFIRTSAVGPVNCRGQDYWALIWDAKRWPVPTDAQFDWFERYYRCKDLTPKEKEKAKSDARAKRDVIKEADLGIPRKTRDIFKREFDAAQKDKKSSFVDRMVEVVSPKTKRK